MQAFAEPLSSEESIRSSHLEGTVEGGGLLQGQGNTHDVPRVGQELEAARCESLLKEDRS